MTDATSDLQQISSTDAKDNPLSNEPYGTFREYARQEGFYEEIEAFSRRELEISDKLSTREEFRSAVLSIGLPALLISFVLLAIAADRIYFLFANEHCIPVGLRIATEASLTAEALPTAEEFPVENQNSTCQPITVAFQRMRLGGRIAVLWIVVSAIAYILYYNRLYSPTRSLERQLAQVQAELSSRRQATSQGRRLHLQEELRELSSTIAVASFDNEVGFEQANKWLESAQNAIDQHKESGLVDAQMRITAIREMIAREGREKLSEKYWRQSSIVVMIGYVTIILPTIIFLNSQDQRSIPLFGIPMFVIAWAAIGSLGAVMYRLYTFETQKLDLEYEIRWLIARPIIGILMGAVAYLALISGLAFFSVPDSFDVTTMNAQQRAMNSLIAFLAGFSDRFYSGLINLLLARTVPEDSNSDQQIDSQNTT